MQRQGAMKHRWQGERMVSRSGVERGTRTGPSLRPG